MTRSEFRRTAERLYGVRWQEAIAVAFEVSLQTVRRNALGSGNVKSVWAMALSWIEGT